MSIISSLRINAFDRNAAAQESSSPSLSGMPYVAEPGLYKATIVSAIAETKTVKGAPLPALVLSLWARHAFTEGHNGRLRLTVFIDANGDGKVPFAHLWRELCFACGVLQEVKTANGGVGLVPHLEAETVRLETPNALGQTELEHVRNLEGKEIALVAERGRPYNGRCYLNARCYLNEQLFSLEDWLKGETKPQYYNRFSLKGIGAPLEYPAQPSADGSAQFTAPVQVQAPVQAPFYPSYPSYAGIPQTSQATPVYPQAQATVAPAQFVGQAVQAAMQAQSAPIAAPAAVPASAPVSAPAMAQGVYQSPYLLQTQQETAEDNIPF